MMGVGFGEMILLAGIALVVIGPDKFPEFAKIVLRTFRDMRTYVDDAKRDIAAELRPVQREIQQLSRYNPEDYIESLAGSVMKENEAAEKKVEATATPPQPAASPEDQSPGEDATPASSDTAAPRSDANNQDEYWADITADSDAPANEDNASDDDAPAEGPNPDPSSRMDG